MRIHSPSNAVLALSLILLPVGVAGCDDGFRKASELGAEPQILTVRATPPEARPGESVTFDALVHWPGATPALVWMLCRPGPTGSALGCASEGFAQAAPPDCNADPLASLCVLGAGETAGYTVPSEPGGTDQGPQTLSIILVAVDAPELLPDCLASFAAEGPGPGCEVALKRLVVSTSDAPNGNPRIQSLVVDSVAASPTQEHVVSRDGEPLDELKVHLGARLDPDSVDELASGEPVDLIASWFTTCGTVEPEKQFLPCDPADEAGPARCGLPPVTWKPGLVGTCQVHAVVRDGRGGVGFVTQPIRIQ